MGSRKMFHRLLFENLATSDHMGPACHRQRLGWDPLARGLVSDISLSWRQGSKPRPNSLIASEPLDDAKFSVHHAIRAIMNC